VLVIADGAQTAAQVDSLVPASSACAVIATSRYRLGALDDVHELRLRPLTAADGAALFREAAGRVDAGSDPDHVRVAEACGGVPLAIRVAAARYRESGQSVAELADQLQDPEAIWEELDDGERSVRRTLRAELLELPESGRLTLGMLGLHPAAPASSQGVAWLRGTSPRVISRDFAALDGRGLVTVAPGGRASAHPLIRGLAVSLLDGMDERSRDAALRRLVGGYAASALAAEGAVTPLRFLPVGPPAESAAAPVTFAGPDQAIAWCGAEAELIPLLCSLAYEMGADDDCWRLAYAFRGYYFAAGAVEPWTASHRVALRSAERCGNRWAQAVTRNNLGMALAGRRQLSAAEAEHSRALEIFRALGDSRGIAATLGHQAWASHAAGRHDLAISLATEAVELELEHENARSVAIMDRTLALASSSAGRHREALRYLAECGEILSGLDLPLDVAMMLNGLGDVRYAMGDFGKAATCYAEAAERGRACGGRAEEARAARGMAAVARAGEPRPRQGASIS